MAKNHKAIYELDNAIGCNCTMSKPTYVMFIRNIFAFDTEFYGYTRHNAAPINFILEEIVALLNLCAVRRSNIPGDKQILGVLLCRFILLFINPGHHH